MIDASATGNDNSALWIDEQRFGVGVGIGVVAAFQQVQSGDAIGSERRVGAAILEQARNEERGGSNGCRNDEFAVRLRRELDGPFDGVWRNGEVDRAIAIAEIRIDATVCIKPLKPRLGIHWRQLLVSPGRARDDRIATCIRDKSLAAELQPVAVQIHEAVRSERFILRSIRVQTHDEFSEAQPVGRDAASAGDDPMVVHHVDRGAPGIECIPRLQHGDSLVAEACHEVAFSGRAQRAGDGQRHKDRSG